MFDRLLKHIRLVWRLCEDPRVNIILKMIFVVVPMIFLMVPWLFDVPDFLPGVGLVDDLVIIALSSLVFRALVPETIVKGHLMNMSKSPEVEAFRHSYEDHNLARSIFWVIFVTTLIGSGLFLVWLMIVLAAFLIRKWIFINRQKKSKILSGEEHPSLHQLLNRIGDYLPDGEFQSIIHPSEEPRTEWMCVKGINVWMVSQIALQEQTPESLAKIAAREAAHILLGHQGLKTVIESDPTALSKLIFRGWTTYANQSANQLAVELLSEEGLKGVNAIKALRVSKNPI